MTTDPTPLQERIAEALAEHWRRKHSTLLTSGPCSGCSHVAADAVAAEVQAAKAEALRKIAPHLNDSGDESFLLAAADEYETGDRA